MKDFSKIAIYSRKSRYTGVGESIENQIELCKEYARRSFGDGLQFLVYEDEGYSGKNIERPEFQRLLRDLHDNKFDMLMCYRLDRISRSVSDCSAILEDIADHNVGFVSIRENFDTSSPMGRAMVYVASVFAQLERETIAERVKDNKYQLYRLGHWQGGKTPLGFRAEKVSGVDESGSKRSHFELQQDEEQLGIVKMLFQKYQELGSLSKVETYLLQNGIMTPQGKEYTKSVIRQILCNPVYATSDPCVYDYLLSQDADLANDRSEYQGRQGLIGYGKTITKGVKNTTRVRAARDNWIISISSHPGVISGDVWVAVQKRLSANKEKFPRTDTSHIALLSGLIRCGKCGAPMMIKGNRINANGEKSFYYKCSRKDRSGGALCDIKNIIGIEFDKGIIERLKVLLSRDGEIYNSIMSSTEKVNSKDADFSKQIRGLDDKIKKNENDSVKIAMKLADSSSDETDAPIYEALRRLSKETATLKERREELAQKSLTAQDEATNLELVREAVKAFAETIDALDIEGRRRLIKLIIKEIVWYGDYCEVALFSDAISSKKNGTLENLSCDRSFSHSQNYTILNNAQTLGQRCFAYRRVNNMTQPQLSELLGLSVTTICRIEKDRHDHVSARAFYIVEKFLNETK